MPDRVHSSNIQVFINENRIPAINSLSVNTSKNLQDITRLGVSHISDKVLGANQTSQIQLGILLTTGATGVDPFYTFQEQGSGFLSTGKFKFELKDTVGVTSITEASMTSYSLNGSVGELVNGSTTYEGNAATFTSAGALSLTDGTDVNFGGFFRPQDIQITTTDSVEGMDSSALHIQNFSLSVDLSRTPVTRLGSRTPRFRYPELPSAGTLNFEAIKNKITGVDLSNLVCDSGVIKIELKDIDGDSVMDFTTSGCCLESVDESTSLDDNTTVSFSYYFPILK